MTRRPFDTRFLETATGGSAQGAPRGERVVTDSRAGVRDALFVALAGPHFDGHDFVPEVLAAGAGGAVVSRSWWERSGGAVENVLVVPDPLAALQELARAHRARFDIPVAAVTGSNGKTTTKEFLAAALAPLGPVLKTAGNLNNHIGVPLTLLRLSAEHAAAVVEIGLNHPGELDHLARLAAPRVGVITSVAAAHLEGLGSLDGVARAKAELAGAIPGDGALVVPAASAELAAALREYRGRRITFGLEPGADLHPALLVSRGFTGTTLEFPDGVELTVRIPGEHAALNALAALAAAGALGVDPREASEAMAAVAPVAGRLRPRTAGGVTLLDDTYNANPASLVASLRVLRDGEASRRWAILGDMLELGPDAASLHEEAGSGAGFLDGLITVGELAASIGRGAVAAGLEPSRVRSAPDGEGAASLLAPDLAPGDAVLIKGSRGMRLETAVEGLIRSLGGEA